MHSFRIYTESVFQKPIFFTDGNYSSLIFKFYLAREMGFYMMDYFIPSILLVTISWVSFWLQADASAPRITIGNITSNILIGTNYNRDVFQVAVRCFHLLLQRQLKAKLYQKFPTSKRVKFGFWVAPFLFLVRWWSLLLSISFGEEGKYQYRRIK